MNNIKFKEKLELILSCKFTSDELYTFIIKSDFSFSVTQIYFLIYVHNFSSEQKNELILKIYNYEIKEIERIEKNTSV